MPDSDDLYLLAVQAKQYRTDADEAYEIVRYTKALPGSLYHNEFTIAALKAIAAFKDYQHAIAQ